MKLQVRLRRELDIKILELYISFNFPVTLSLNCFQNGNHSKMIGSWSEFLVFFAHALQCDLAFIT